MILKSVEYEFVFVSIILLIATGYNMKYVIPKQQYELKFNKLAGDAPLKLFILSVALSFIGLVAFALLSCRITVCGIHFALGAVPLLLSLALFIFSVMCRLLYKNKEDLIKEVKRK